MPELQDLSKMYKEFGALEECICEWLEQKKASSREAQHKKIYGCIKSLSFTEGQLLDLSAYLMVRMGMARFVNQGLRNLEPLVAIGYKNLRSQRSNASKPRKGGRNKSKQELLRIMNRYRKADNSFDDFLDAVCCSPDNDMDVEQLETGEYKITIYDANGGACEDALYKKSTLRTLYSKAKKLKK